MCQISSLSENWKEGEIEGEESERALAPCQHNIIVFTTVEAFVKLFAGGVHMYRFPLCDVSEI